MSGVVLSHGVLSAIVDGFAPLRMRMIGQEHVFQARLHISRHVRHRCMNSCVTIIADAQVPPIDAGAEGDIFDVKIIEAKVGTRWTVISVQEPPALHLRTGDTYTFDYALTLTPGPTCPTAHGESFRPQATSHGDPGPR